LAAASSTHRGSGGKHAQFKPRHFHHFGHGGRVLKFGAGFVLKFGQAPASDLYIKSNQLSTTVRRRL
jgi:hypothetical protein